MREAEEGILHEILKHESQPQSHLLLSTASESADRIHQRKLSYTLTHLNEDKIEWNTVLLEVFTPRVLHSPTYQGNLPNGDDRPPASFELARFGNGSKHGFSREVMHVILT